MHFEAGCATPPLLDLVSDGLRHSPFQRALQYLRGLTLSDVQDRCLAVVYLCGHTDKQAWVRDHPLSWTWGSSVEVASAWLFFRSLKFKHPPLTLVINSDPRVPSSVKLENSRAIHSTPLCCVDAPCTGKLIKRTHNYKQLLDRRNLQLSDGISRSPVTNAICEVVHARNQRKHSENSSWALFVGRYLNEQAMYHTTIVNRTWAQQFESLRPLIEPARQLGQEAQEPSAASAETLAKLPAGTSGVGVFYHKCLQLDKEMNEPRQVGDDSYWKSAKQRWTELKRSSPAEAAACKMVGIHNASKPRVETTVDNAQLPSAKAKQTTALMKVACDKGVCMPCTSDIMLPRLRPDSACPSCSIRGDAHFRPTQRFDSLLRRQSDVYGELSAANHADTAAIGKTGKTKLMVRPQHLSPLPVSTELYCLERKQWRGGLKAIEHRFDNTIMGVGRDCGDIPEKMQPLTRCKLGFCSKRLSSQSARSIHTQLKSVLTSIVSLAGGPKKVPSKMPSPNLVTSSCKVQTFNV